MRPYAVLAAMPFAVASIAACGSSSTSSQGGASVDYCTAARALSGDGKAFESFGTNLTVDQIKAAFAPFARDLDAVDNSAPSQISADTHKLRQATDAVNDKIQKASTLADATAAASDFSTVSASLDQSGKNIDSYTKTTCGFTISSTGASSSSSSDSGSVTLPPPDTGSSSSSAST